MIEMAKVTNLTKATFSLTINGVTADIEPGAVADIRDAEASAFVQACVSTGHLAIEVDPVVEVVKAKKS